MPQENKPKFETVLEHVKPVVQCVERGKPDLSTVLDKFDPENRFLN